MTLPVRMVRAGERKKGDVNRMINFDHMTAFVQASLARTAMHVRRGAPWNVASFLGNPQKCGRSFVAGEVR